MRVIAIDKLVSVSSYIIYELGKSDLARCKSLNKESKCVLRRTSPFDQTWMSANGFGSRLGRQKETMAKICQLPGDTKHGKLKGFSISSPTTHRQQRCATMNEWKIKIVQASFGPTKSKYALDMSCGIWGTQRPLPQLSRKKRVPCVLLAHKIFPHCFEIAEMAPRGADTTLRVSSSPRLETATQSPPVTQNKTNSFISFNNSNLSTIVA